MFTLTTLMACIQDAYLPSNDAAWNPTTWTSVSEEHGDLINSETESYSGASHTYFDSNQTYGFSSTDFDNDDIRLLTLTLWDHNEVTSEKQAEVQGMDVIVVTKNKESAAKFVFEVDGNKVCGINLYRSARLYDNGVDWRYFYHTNVPYNVSGDDIYTCWNNYAVEEVIEGLDDFFNDAF